MILPSRTNGKVYLNSPFKKKHHKMSRFLVTWDFFINNIGLMYWLKQQAFADTALRYQRVTLR